jgi:hypothetical protein
MQYEDVEALREQHAAWRLLRANSAALVLSFLDRVFGQKNAGPVAAGELTSQLADELYAVNEQLGEAAFPKPAKAYLDDWAAPGAGWLRKFHPPGSDEPHFDVTPPVERALSWVRSLQARAFVGTESRLNTIFELLRQMVYGAEGDPQVRLAELRRRRDELDREIVDVEAGHIALLDATGQRDRYQQFAATARDLLSDFREVEANFRALDRQLRERVAGFDGGKGELLDVVLGDRDAITDSDQGRSLRPRLRRVHALRARTVRQPRPATADRHAASEDPRHRAVHRRRRVRRQHPGGRLLAAAEPDHRGVPAASHRPRADPCSRGGPVTAWTTPADVLHRLRRRWDSGELLRQCGNAAAWKPIAYTLHGPTAGELAADLAAARRWAASWEHVPGLRVEHRRVGGRLIGANDVPAKAWVDGIDQAWVALGVVTQAGEFIRLLADTRHRAPRLAGWILAHPMRLLELAPVWTALVDAALWIDQHAHQPLYLRQVDVPGVDTKFIQRHRAVLADLLDLQLAAERIETGQPRSEFTARYRLRSRPTYLRLRSLDPATPLAGGYTELAVRCEELAARPPQHTEVYIVENEITYLAFPDVPNAVALFGAGYAVGARYRIFGNEPVTCYFSGGRYWV